MISYTLKCENDHRFDSWFQSSDAYEKLHAAGMVNCTHCNSTKVEKAIMAPRVHTARKAAAAPDQSADQSMPDAQSDLTTPDLATPTAQGALSTPSNDNERAIAALKSKVEANSEYVGMEFASQARAIHDGDAPERPIYGEAKPEEALKLLQDGVPVLPLPFTPKRKIN